MTGTRDEMNSQEKHKQAIGMFVPLVVTEIFFVGLNENDFDNQLGKLQCNFLDAAI